jgi:hypothetical protein
MKCVGYSVEESERLTAQVYSDNFFDWFGNWLGDKNNSLNLQKNKTNEKFNTAEQRILEEGDGVLRLIQDELGLYEGEYSEEDVFDKLRAKYQEEGLVYVNKRFYNQEKEGDSLSSFFTGRMAHEIQHHIQAEEGFAKGGNEIQSREQIESFINFGNIKGNERAEYGNDKSIQRQIQSLLKKLTGLEDNSKIAKAISSEDTKTQLSTLVYKLLAGEVEARNVENRIGLNGDERLNTPLFETQDVKSSDQIVNFDNFFDMQNGMSDVQFLNLLIGNGIVEFDEMCGV